MQTRTRNNIYLYSSCLKKLFLRYKFPNVNGIVGYSNLAWGSENRRDEILTIKEVRERLMKFMGVKLGFTQTKEDRSDLHQYLPRTQDELPKRTIKDSFQSAMIPLGSNVKLQERYGTALGSVRYGRLMEDMDMFAAWVAANYVQNPKQPPDVPSPYIMMTILVDHISFSEYIPLTHVDIRISGHVSWVGGTSIEVTVWLEQDEQGIWNKITTAVFLMAARNATMTAGAYVNRLVPANEEEKSIIARGEARKQQRASLGTGPTMTQTPSAEEQEIIHKMFIESVDPSANRRVLPPGSVWMTDTQLSNTVFSHTEDRNFHDTVFGGFLMRCALEMAWFVAYFHSKSKPMLRSISNIKFQKPVELGSILFFHGQVVYTEKTFMQIFVHGDVTTDSSLRSTTSIVFHFTYESSEEVTSVKPSTYYEAMMFIDGRRQLMQVLAQDRYRH